MNFGDEVLWFVKTLFVLYAIFFLFSVFRQINATVGLIFLVAMTIGHFILYKSISVPYFSLGVILSLYKDQNIRILITIWVVAICYAILGFLMFETNFAGHSAINAVLICIFILALSIRTWEIKIPAILGVMSFDLYIVHNKVLMAQICNYDEVPLWLFVTVSLTITVAFFFFRTKVFKI